ncbi:MAG: hypothetical protein GY783_12010 [Gammaproteobacteria bacterium]|nr:hypothetical protein [Gammaproteobacteria bacterium]
MSSRFALLGTNAAVDSAAFKQRKLKGMVDFPLQPYIDLGFRRFKLLRARPGSMTGY